MKKLGVVIPLVCIHSASRRVYKSDVTHGTRENRYGECTFTIRLFKFLRLSLCWRVCAVRLRSCARLLLAELGFRAHFSLSLSMQTWSVRGHGIKPSKVLALVESAMCHIPSPFQHFHWLRKL